MSETTTTTPLRIDSPARRIAKEFIEDPVAIIGLALFVLVAVIAIAAPWIGAAEPL